MKQVYSPIFFLLLTGTTMAQVANGGFENWSGNVPDNWSTANIAPLNSFPITQSSDAHTGSFSVKGEVVVNPIFSTQVSAPYLQTVTGVPVSNDPTSITGSYQFSPIQSTANFVVGCTVIDVNGLPTGIGVLQIFDATSSYSTFSMPIDYTMGGDSPAASVTISFSIADTNALSSIGSWYLVDDVMVDGATGMNESSIQLSELGTPYPLPITDAVTIPMKLATAAQVNVTILDLLGRAVHTVHNNTLAPGNHRLNWTPEKSVANGIYFVRVSDHSGSTSKRLLLQR